MAASARLNAVSARGLPRPLALVPPQPLRVVDVALFYGERGGGIRTYIEEKALYARRSGAFEHHVVIPGSRERHRGGWHELRSLRVASPNGYRLPLGTDSLKRTLIEIDPDVVLLHDPFWAGSGVADTVHDAGGRVIAVHHASCQLDAAGLPSPESIWRPLLRAWMRRAYRPVDAVMSVVDTVADCGRPAQLPLRFGLDPAFTPQPREPRGDEVLYVGRLGREKGVFSLLEAAARSRDPWPLRLIGSGPAGDAVAARVQRLGLAQRVSFQPFIADRERLAQTYARARCVVMPGPYETFGLVALEAAASGARVVACETAPAVGVIGELAHTFVPGDTTGLLRAVQRARDAAANHDAARRLGQRLTWARAFEAELADLRMLRR